MVTGCGFNQLCLIFKSVALQASDRTMRNDDPRNPNIHRAKKRLFGPIASFHMHPMWLMDSP
jgi:hypothetical protein